MLKLKTSVILGCVAAGAVVITTTAYAVSLSPSSTRADCPGKVVCPLTGEPVCKDRCPLNEAQKEDKPILPSCCQSSN